MADDGLAKKWSGDSERVCVLDGSSTTVKTCRVDNLGAARGTAQGAVFGLQHRLRDWDPLNLDVHGRRGLLFRWVLCVEDGVGAKRCVNGRCQWVVVLDKRQICMSACTCTDTRFRMKICV